MSAAVVIPSVAAAVAPASLKVLVVGNGGREHALAWKLRQSPLVARWRWRRATVAPPATQSC